MKYLWLPEGERQIGHGEGQRQIGRPGDVVDITPESAEFHLRKVRGRLADPKNPAKGRAPCLVECDADGKPVVTKAPAPARAQKPGA